MSRYKTFDATGVATSGRLYAGDLNAIQDRYADLAGNYTQNVDVGSIDIGENGLLLSRIGAGQAQLSGRLRLTGGLDAAGGVILGNFTTTARDAIGAGLAPKGTMIFNTTTAQLEVNTGTDGARAWRAVAGGASARVTRTSDLSVGDGSPTLIPWTTEESDDFGMHDNVTNNDRLTAVVAGVYLVQGRVYCSSTSTPVWTLTIYKNNSFATTYDIDQKQVTISGSPLDARALVRLAVGDFVNMYISQLSGGSRSLIATNSYRGAFEAAWVAP